MRIDRTALIRGLAAAANRERERRAAAEQAANADAWERLLDQIAEMGHRMLAGPDAGDRELAEQIVRAPDWAHIDELRTAADRSRIEAVALAWTIDPDAAVRLLSENYSRRDLT